MLHGLLLGYLRLLRRHRAHLVHGAHKACSEDGEDEAGHQFEQDAVQPKRASALLQVRNAFLDASFWRQYLGIA